MLRPPVPGPTVTCLIRYRLDPWRLAEFEDYARRWLALAPRFGGRPHGWFLPHEGANDLAYALVSFDDLAAYEAYRREAAEDPDCLAALEHAERTRCYRRSDRTFLRPVLPGSDDGSPPGGG